MSMDLKHRLFFIIVCLFLSFQSQAYSAGHVQNSSGQTYIVDRYGEKWDIRQAISLGFEPEKFEHGIGRNTIKPIENPEFSEKSKPGLSNPRVIGISRDSTAQAYSIPNLSYHEIANSVIENKPIAVAY